MLYTKLKSDYELKNPFNFSNRLYYIKINQITENPDIQFSFI